MKRRWLLRIVLSMLPLVAITLMTSPSGVDAHGEEVSVDPQEARPGAQITVTGKGFAANQKVRIRLEGVAGTTPLGEATCDPMGMFTTRVALPADLAPGSYQLKVSDGEETATLDFSVLATAVEQSAGSTSVAADLQFERTLPETVAIAVIAALLAAAGAVLVLKGAVREAQGH